MKDPLSNLGQSLADEFRNSINQWFVLESAFSTESVFGSIEAVVENSNAEVSWDDFTATTSLLEDEFLPEDLVDGFFENPVPEQDSENLDPQNRTLKQLSNSSSKNNYFTNKQSDIGTDEGSKRRGFILNDDDATREDSTSFIRNEEKSDTKKSRFHTDEFNDESNNSLEQNSISDKHQLNEWEENDHSNNQTWKPPQQSISNEPTSLLNPTSEPERSQVDDDDSSNSIWSTPLRNLNDFAGQVSRPSNNGNKNSKERINRFQSSTEHSSPVSNAPANQFNQEPNEGWLNITDWSNNQNSINHPATGSQTAGSVPLHTSNLQPENSPFPTAAPPQPKIPDTEELLEALTARILRDFRRYYP